MSKIVQLRSVTLTAIVIVIALGGFGLGLGAAHLPFRAKVTTDNAKVDRLKFSELNSIYDILKDKFDGDLVDDKLLDGAKFGLTAATGDPYTTYLNAEAAKALADDLAGTLSGIGAEVGIRAQRLVIIAPIADSPAAKAGLRAKDQIIKIDDTDPSGLSLDEAVSKIRGKEGTKVRLTIVRGTDKPFEVEITRAVITVPSVKWSMKDGGVGYIQISRFGDDTSDKIVTAAGELKNQGAKKIILDLRDDPGGYLDAAVKVASQFLPQGKTVVEERKGDKTIDKLTSEGEGQLIGLPMVVIINGGSASASEIVAGALHDNSAAKLIGEKSFGKGSVQEVQKLGSGGEVKVTVAHWYTPGGRNINKEGIVPDTEVKREQADFDAGRDPQLDKALQLLK